MKITVSTDEGIVHGVYDVVQDEPDTIEEMDALSDRGVYDRENIMDYLKYDIPIYLKREAKDNGS